MSDLKQLLLQAQSEIQILRRQNEILSAKVEMIELFACVLHTKPATHSVGMGEDVVWKLQQYLTDMEKDDVKERTGGLVADIPPGDREGDSSLR